MIFNIFLRLLTIVLFPINVAIAFIYFVAVFLISIIVWFFTGNFDCFVNRLSKFGPERIILWPIYIKKEKY